MSVDDIQGSIYLRIEQLNHGKLKWPKKPDFDRKIKFLLDTSVLMTFNNRGELWTLLNPMPRTIAEIAEIISGYRLA